VADINLPITRIYARDGDKLTLKEKMEKSENI